MFIRAELATSLFPLDVYAIPFSTRSLSSNRGETISQNMRRQRQQFHLCSFLYYELGEDHQFSSFLSSSAARSLVIDTQTSKWRMLLLGLWPLSNRTNSAANWLKMIPPRETGGGGVEMSCDAYSHIFSGKKCIRVTRQECLLNNWDRKLLQQCILHMELKWV